MFIITANSAQAFTLQSSQRYPKAVVLSLQSFVSQFFPDETIKLLSAAEEVLLWEHCVTLCEQDSRASISALALLVQEAWQIIRHWDISRQEVFSETPWLSGVIQYFSDYCRKQACDDFLSLLQNACSKTFPSALLRQVFCFYGFLELTPLQKKFIQHLKKSGAEVQFFNVSDNPLGLFHTHSYEDADAEIKAAFLWAKAQRAEHPDQTLGIIIPQLQKHREPIEAILEEISLHEVAIVSPENLFNAGLVQTALQVLQLMEGGMIRVEDLMTLLRSPYLGLVPDLQDKHACAAMSNFAVRLRACQLSEISWDVLLLLANSFERVAEFLKLLTPYRTRKKKTLREWMQTFQACLTAVKFLERLSLTDEEVNLSLQLANILSADYIFSHELYSFSEAYNAVKKMATFTTVSQENLKSFLRVMNPLDALTTSFDQVWYVQATQEQFPFKLSINPLIPRRLQKKYAVWAIDVAEKNKLAQSYFDYFIHTASQLHLSYAKEAGGKRAIPVSIFKKSVLEEDGVLSAAKETQAVKFKPQQENNLLSLQNKSIPGGAGALRSERLCSMQAFGKYRLRLAELPEVILGLTPIERGLMMHRALHLLWQQIQTHERLVAFEAAELEKLIERIILVAFRLVSWDRRKLLPKTLLQLEKQQMQRLLKRWLALEATRAPFKIYALEKESQVFFAGKTWRLRMDRIDQLEDGRLLLIDYKTGQTSVRSLLADTFSEPQLPLYCVTQAEKIDAIAFAEISHKTLKMVGLTSESINLGGFGELQVVEDWSETKQTWAQLLSDLTTQFIHSQAILSPLEGKTTCARCGLQSFCRIYDQ